MNRAAPSVKSGTKWPLSLFQSVLPLDWSRVVANLTAGISLAAMNIPQAMGYTKIAGTPVVTGLYTLLLPLVAFAALGSSRYLVVAADSATAAILAGGLAAKATAGSEHYVALAGLVALLTARVSAAGALLPTRLPGGLPLANPVGGFPHRRRFPGRHRGARRNVAPTGAQQPTSGTTVRGAPANKPDAPADARRRRGGRRSRSALPTFRAAASWGADRRRGSCCEQRRI